MPIPTTSQMVSRILETGSLRLSFKYMSARENRMINAVIAKLLSRLDRIFLLDTFNTILGEAFVNAIKANAKRVYFKSINIDINDPVQYAEGLHLFKQNVIGQFEVIKDDLTRSPYNVIFAIKKNPDNLVLQVTNNVPMLPEELKRVRLRKEKAREFNDFNEAYEEVFDDTEGAGLGIVLITLLLKSSGIGAENYILTSNGERTIMQLTVPRNLRPLEITTSIKDHLLAEVDGLPTFPKNILDLQRLCNDPDSSLSCIVEKVSLDPALTADVLKLSNSAGFIQMKRIETIIDAVKTIGLKNLNAILITSSARRILDKRYTRFEQVWTHCNKAAFYAVRLAQRFKLGRIVEGAYLAGLLHDFGKIVMLSTDLNLTNRISDMVQDRKIRTSTVLEEISIGVSHANMGEMIARKWSFPEYLVESIKYHHSPLLSSEKHRDTVAVTYLANILCGIEARRYNFLHIEEEILERFGIDDENTFRQMHEEIKKQYSVQTA